MKNVLYINACPREESRTNELAECLLEKLNGHICSVNIFDENISPLDSQLLTRRDMLLSNSETDDELFRFAKQFAAADTVVIAAPYWDLMFPSMLKIYLENITVCGITFRYSKQGFPISFCKAKDLYYVTTSGGFIKNNNFGFDYVKALATSFFGIDNVRFFSAEGLDIKGNDIKDIMSKAKESIIVEE